MFALSLLSPALTPDRITEDQLTQPAQLRVDGYGLQPGILRIPKGGSVSFSNSNEESKNIILVDEGRRFTLEPYSERQEIFTKPGIQQVYIEAPVITHSSFVIVEPVSDYSGF